MLSICTSSVQLRRPCHSAVGALPSFPKACWKVRALRSIRHADSKVVTGKQQQSLPSLSHDIQQSFFELCVENAGRPAAAALAQFVRATAAAYKAGHSMSRLQLEVRLGGFGEVDLNTASCRLTETDKAYRQQFIDTVYLTMQMIVLHGEGFNKGMASAITSQREWTDADWSTLSIIDTILAGQATEDEYTAVKLDRALATAGASGGVASAHQTVAPQFIPISQLVLMTIKAEKESEV